MYVCEIVVIESSLVQSVVGTTRDTNSAFNDNFKHQY
jgi:hypothetical protein